MVVVMEKVKYCVYRHRKVSDGEVFYIGISSNLKRPYNEIHRSDWWKRTVEKHGRSVEILRENLSKEDAVELEVFLIEIYGRKDLRLGTLVNMTGGGEGTTQKSKGTVDKWRESKSWYTHSEETLKKIVKTRKDNGGYIVTEETKRILSLKNKGRKHTLEACAKITAAQLGRKALPHVIEALVAPTRKQVINTVTGIIYPSCRLAAESIGWHPDTLSDHLRGRTKNKTTLKYLEI